MKIWRCRSCKKLFKREKPPMDACPHCSSKDGYQPLEDENIVGD